MRSISALGLGHGTLRTGGSGAGPRPPAIASISVCSPNGAGGAGNCPSGSFDTHQIVLAPDGSGNAINAYGTRRVSATRFFPPLPRAVAQPSLTEIPPTNSGVASNMMTGTVVNSAPGIFPIIVNGTIYPAGVFANGELVLLPTRQGVSGVTVTIGNVTVPADFAGLVAAGEFQINLVNWYCRSNINCY